MRTRTDLRAGQASYESDLQECEFKRAYLYEKVDELDNLIHNWMIASISTSPSTVSVTNDRVRTVGSSGSASTAGR